VLRKEVKETADLLRREGYIKRILYAMSERTEIRVSSQGADKHITVDCYDPGYEFIKKALAASLVGLQETIRSNKKLED
jgi:hypothetical protein